MAEDMEATRPGRPRAEAAKQLLVVVVPMTAIVVGVHLLRGDASGDIEGQAIGPLLLSVLALGSLALLLVALVLRLWSEPIASVGLRRASPLHALLWGGVALAGGYAAAITVSLTWVIVQVAQGTSLDAIARDRLSALAPLAGLPAIAVLPLTIFIAVWEETLFRGFLLSRLRRLFAGERPDSRLAAVLAVLASSILFAAGHGYQGALGLAQTFVLGVVFALVATWRGDIWSTIFAHCAIDTFSLLMLPHLSSALKSLPPG